MSTPKLAAVVRILDEVNLIPWLVANLTHANAIYLCDGGSVDGSWELINKMAKTDRRIRPVKFPHVLKRFYNQAEHFNYAFNAACADGLWEWIQYFDADEICTIDLQKTLKQCLKAHPFDRYVSSNFDQKVGMEIPFLFLSQKWTHYWADASEHPIMRLWNYIPRFENRKDHTYKAELPDRRIVVPLGKILHFNWAMIDRLERKLPIYEKKFGYKRWYPEDKYHDERPLPEGCTWYSPKGKVVGPEYTKRRLTHARLRSWD